MDTSDSSDNPIDLSRRCDSVETRKTPSPYNSSSFAETSPSLENDSPTSNPRKKTNIRSDTPPNCYQSTEYSERKYSTSTQAYPYPPAKRSQSSPKTVQHHHYIHEQPINNNDDDDINPYIMHAVALQQKLQSIPATVSTPSSPESASNSQYPMMLGRDGKLARPFKAYPRDPLTNPFTAIPSSDAHTDRMSAERFNVFRQQMLEQIHAANGGRPTVTNPKMRRTSSKSYDESEPSHSEMEFQSQQQSLINNCPSDSSETGSTNNKGPIKDNAYYERRRKNNAAAKKSRDRRRIKEDEIAIRAAFLERENMELKIELAATKRQLAQFAS